MKLLFLALCASAAVADVSHLLRSAGSDRQAQILKQTFDVEPNGKYYYEYQNDNGINEHQHGEQIQLDPQTSVNSVGGEVGWQTPEGETVFLKYSADQNGYQPQGSHIPTPPPIPPAILRSLEYIRAHPPPPERR